MSTLFVLLGLALAAFGATASVSVRAVSRLELTRWVARKLEGAGAAVTLLSRPGDLAAAADALVAIGVTMAGVSTPWALRTAGLATTLALELLFGVPVVCLVAYFLPRAVGQRWPETVVRALGAALPRRRDAGRPDRARPGGHAARGAGGPPPGQRHRRPGGRGRAGDRDRRDDLRRPRGARGHDAAHPDRGGARERRCRRARGAGHQFGLHAHTGLPRLAGRDRRDGARLRRHQGRPRREGARCGRSPPCPRRAAAPTRCSTSGASDGTWPWCSTSSAARRAS